MVWWKQQTAFFYGFVSKSLQIARGLGGWFTSFSHVLPSGFIMPVKAGKSRHKIQCKAIENAGYCLNNHCPWNSVQKSAFRIWCLPKPFKFSATSWLEKNFDTKDCTTWPRYESFTREIVAALFLYLDKEKAAILVVPKYPYRESWTWFSYQWFPLFRQINMTAFHMSKSYQYGRELLQSKDAPTLIWSRRVGDWGREWIHVWWRGRVTSCKMQEKMGTTLNN